MKTHIKAILFPLVFLLIFSTQLKASNTSEIPAELESFFEALADPKSEVALKDFLMASFRGLSHPESQAAMDAKFVIYAEALATSRGRNALDALLAAMAEIYADPKSLTAQNALIVSTAEVLTDPKHKAARNAWNGMEDVLIGQAVVKNFVKRTVDAVMKIEAKLAACNETVLKAIADLESKTALQIWDHAFTQAYADPKGQVALKALIKFYASLRL